jgi:aryl-alcohol dehydrogenase-like predicted oxidoreductase
MTAAITSVRTKPLGSTGLVVSSMGLGLAALGRPAYINLHRDADLGADRSIVAMERRCHEMLDAAFQLGIRYVDVARSYGLAEQFLASWLHARRIPAGAVTVGTKWGYTYTGEWRVDAPVHEMKDLSVATLERQVAESRIFLGDHLQLLQIHSATLESGVLDDRRVLDELARLRSMGLTIGLTVTGARQADVIRRALLVEVKGANLFQVVQATWNLLETSSGPALADAKSQGCGVIVKEALANGRLTDDGVENETAALRRFAERLGTSVDVLALAAVASQPWADVVLSGAVTQSQLQRNASALELKVNAEDFSTVALPPDEYWTRRSAAKWG